MWPLTNRKHRVHHLQLRLRIVSSWSTNSLQDNSIISFHPLQLLVINTRRKGSAASISISLTREGDVDKARYVQVSPAPATFCLSEFHTYYEEIFVLSLEICLAFPLLLRTSQLTSQMIPYLLIHFGRYQSPRQTWNKSEKSQIALVSDKLMPVVHLYDRIIVAVTDRNHDTIGREGLLSGTSIIANQLSTCSCLMICILQW